MRKILIHHNAKALEALYLMCAPGPVKGRGNFLLNSAEHGKGSLCLASNKLKEEMGPGGRGKKVPQKAEMLETERLQEL